VPAALERSRSGSGGHVWLFFAEPIPASLARKLGAHLLTETMERRSKARFVTGLSATVTRKDGQIARQLTAMTASVTCAHE
jgi:hypothetical protein